MSKYLIFLLFYFFFFFSCLLLDSFVLIFSSFWGLVSNIFLLFFLTCCLSLEWSSFPSVVSFFVLGLLSIIFSYFSNLLLVFQCLAFFFLSLELSSFLSVLVSSVGVAQLFFFFFLSFFFFFFWSWGSYCSSYVLSLSPNWNNSRLKFISIILSRF